MIIQDGRSISLGLDGLECDFASMSGKLSKNMAMAISTYSLDTDANPLTD